MTRIVRDKNVRAAEYLGHVLQAIERIGRFTEDVDEAGFLRNDLIQDAVIRNFEIIGEACRNVVRHCPDFVAAHPQLPLLDAYEMRNALAHGYHRVDLELVWKAIESSLPAFKGQIEAALQHIA